MENALRMTETMTEQNLLAECRNGSRKAFELIYQANQRRVFSVALNFFGGREEIAEDIAQQVFLKIFSKLAGFRGEAELTTWIYRMTVNACIDEQRKKRRFFSVGSFFGELRARKTLDEKFEQREISGEVQ